MVNEDRVENGGLPTEYFLDYFNYPFVLHNTKFSINQSNWIIYIFNYL